MSQRGTTLLGLARAAIEQRLHPDQHVEPAPLRPRETPWLEQPGAVFITLSHRGDLRGCVGTVEAYRPLRQDVEANARAAAFDDPRFPPLTVDELATLTLEVSLLSPLEPVAGDTQAAIEQTLVPGRDGVVLTWGTIRSTFLPQVWDQLPTPTVFLAHLKEKAGLDSNFWHPEIQVERYRVEKWSSD